tara:strand:+ start:101 stop:523 length:423 start_codon:yes stop_codon:yes gene_type:complete
MSIVAIVTSLILLMLLAYRGISVLLLAPLMACLAVLLSGDAAFLLPIYTDAFMSALGNYVIQFFPLFLLGALFGQLMADSGAAQSIANGIVKNWALTMSCSRSSWPVRCSPMAAYRCLSLLLPFIRSAVNFFVAPMCPNG